MRPLTLALVIFLLLFARQARANISFQLGTDAGYDPDVVCWKHPTNKCPDAKSPDEFTGWRCEKNKQKSDGSDTIVECPTAEEIKEKSWRTGVCGDTGSSASSPASAAKTKRRVMLKFNAMGDIRQIMLTGSVVRVFADATSGEIILSSPSSKEGGDYEVPSTSVQAADSIAVARLVPTCRTVFVDVPDAPGKVSFDSSPSPAQCVDPSCDGGGLHRVLVNTVGAKHILTAKITSGLGVSELKTEWSDEIPLAVKLRITKVLFTWRGSCLYDAKCARSAECSTPCPAARIPGAAIDENHCVPSLVHADTGDGYSTCVYTCGQEETNSGFSLPNDVVFETGAQKDTWTEKLVQNDQAFTGFANRGDRQFAVALPPRRANVRNLSEAAVDGLKAFDRFAVVAGSAFESDFSYLPSGIHRVTHIDLLAPNGVHFDVVWPQQREPGDRIAPAPARISVPGATCHDQLSAQYFGEFQAFGPYVVELDKGEFPLKPPGDSFRPWWVGARLSGVYLNPVSSSPNRLGGEIEGIVERRFFDVPWTVALSIAFQISGHGYEPIGYDRRVEAQPQLALNRISLRVMGSRLLWERLHLYGALGFWGSRPLNAGDYPLAGTQWGGVADLGLHFAFLRPVSAHFGGFVYFPDPVRRFITEDPKSSSAFKTDLLPTLGVKLGFGGWMPL